MPGRHGVTWLGEEVMAKIVVATKESIDKTTEAAAKDAQESHWWQKRTGNLERNTFAEPAQVSVVKGEIRGRFGSSMRAEGFYGLFLERREPWLRPAADRHFRELKLRLKGAVRWT
jgi:hypothetical protein